MNIFKKIPMIMGEVGAIEKNRKNQAQGYSFRGIDDVYHAMQPLLAKHGVFFAPNVLRETREERTGKSGGTLIYTVLAVEFIFFADDGSSFKASTVGEAMDSGDKSANKAMSAALKYALLQVFCIPTQEDNDMENHSPEPLPKFSAPSRIPESPKAETSTPDSSMATFAQVNRLTAIQLKVGMSDETLKNIANGLGISSRSAIPKDKYQTLCNLVENYKKD